MTCPRCGKTPEEHGGSQEILNRCPIYQFQCGTCFITSGIMSANKEDAPCCCGGERMYPMLILPPAKQR